YNFFNVVLYNVGYSGLINSTIDSNKISELLYHSEAMFEFTKEIITSSDTGVKDIIIRKDKDEETGKDKFIPFFVHEVDNEEHFLPIFAESSGTKSLYHQLGRYQVVLKLGGILCLDEFDINLHPHILPKLINLFECDKKNQSGAQLLFTTHNSEIMEYMGKYRTYLVEKENNECFAYRLDEIPSDIIRNDRAILPLYNSGKLGGVPNL
ncbi:TPA: ATP/GTP-binding protein, partial [Vibrio cholerae]